MNNQEIQIYKSGVHNLLSSEIIPKDASSDENNWFTQDGRIKLINGRTPVNSEGTTGAIYGEIFGYKANGTKIHWRKAGTKIQYDNGTTWVDVVTGLTATADYAFTNYSSLAGTFTFAFGIDGIYKFINANPTNYISLYDSTINFKGKAFIDKGRTILWDRPEDKTGLYGSWVDNQRTVSGSTGVYTSVAGEATVSLGGTLAFKAGDAHRSCFSVVITLTGTGEVYTDSFIGTLTGSLGGTGTINYVTGVYTLSNAGVGTAAYQWENPNLRGVTDFRHSATRIAGEGFQFPQDEGGDPILTVLIGSDGYYSIKSQSAYLLTLGDDDLTATNDVYRKQMGVPSYRAATVTTKGIVFMNTASPEKPEMTILQKNTVGDAIEPVVLFPQFAFSNYNYDDCTIDTFERYVIVACRSAGFTYNNIILLCNPSSNTVDITSYPARTFASSDGLLYCGSPITLSVYYLYNGFDDDGLSIDNFWIGKAETWNSENLKKHRKLRLKGHISVDQSYEVYVDYDGAGFQLVGTVLGSGSYVDYTAEISVGSSIVGTEAVGGSAGVDIYPYFMEIRLKKIPKFRKRTIKFVALGIGYVDIDYQMDWDIMTFTDKIPSRFRQKQNVSLDGEDINMAAPEF